MVQTTESFQALKLQLEEGAESQEAARLAGGALGHALVESPPTTDQLRELRTSLARKAHGKNFVSGYLTALQDLLSAVERSKIALSEREEAKAIAARPISRAIVLALAESPLGPSQLAQGVQRDQAQISRELDALEEAEVLRTIESPGVKSRPRELTALGHVIAAQLREEAVAGDKRETVAANLMQLVGLVLRAKELDPEKLTKQLATSIADARAWVDLFMRHGEREGLVNARGSTWHGAPPDDPVYDRFFARLEPMLVRKMTEAVAGHRTRRPVLCTIPTRADRWTELLKEAKLGAELELKLVREVVASPPVASTPVIFDDSALVDSDITARLPLERIYGLKPDEREDGKMNVVELLSKGEERTLVTL